MTTKQTRFYNNLYYFMLGVILTIFLMEKFAK